MGCYLQDEHVIIWMLDIILLIVVCMMGNILLPKLFVWKCNLCLSNNYSR